MIVRGYHGTTEVVAKALLGGTPFLSSQNEGDWLGSGVYFWQDAPRRAEWWARRISRAKGVAPAVLVADIDLSDSLDLLDSWGFERLKTQYKVFNTLLGTPTQEPLELQKGGTVWPSDGTPLVDRNKRDKAFLDFASIAIGKTTG